MSETKVIAAIVARSSSPARPARLLTDRALTTAHGQSSLAHIVRRLSLCAGLNALTLAAGDPEADAGIILAAAQLGLPAVAGHPRDMPRRLLMAAESFNAAHVVRVNGNFPLIDPWALDDLISRHLQKNSDYSSNSHYRGVVYGLGAEIFKAAALRKLIAGESPGGAGLDARVFMRRPGDFSVNLEPADKTAPDLRVSLDFAADVPVVEAIFERLGEPDNAAVIDFFADRPEFAASAAGAAEVGLQKVLLFPEKLAALKNNGPGSRDLSYPISVELSLTNRCNQNCRWCSDKKLRARTPDLVNPDMLELLFADLARGGARGVTIEGGGEPTLAPFFEEAVRSAAARGLAVGLITNGLDLFPPERDSDIYRRFEWIRVSLDAAERGQYLRLKGVDGFEAAMAAIGRLVEAAAPAAIGVGYVLTSENDEPNLLQHLISTLRAMGVNYIQIRPVVDHPEMVSSLSAGFLKKFETPDFSVNLAALTENRASGNLGLPCLAHSLSTVISADGAVWLCGRLNAAEECRPLGRLTEAAFAEIWRGPERAAQTAEAADPDFCKSHCPQCRMTKYNQLLADIDRLKTKNFI
ncbi:MAG: radical SAM protein [Candidatus Adiutrix sp.]|jgi:spore coat polysaccharide biosynthesis protein SpsF (cytidylyltransferase family)/MoaA/NifB/PqqE/SkfB family radical SAM enzyme|nr:radical SAM protein [Candidatus Adiutrix sp.]